MGLTLAAPRTQIRGAERDHRGVWLVGLAVVVGFVLRVLYSVGDDVVVSNDEATYLSVGLNLWSGNGFTTLSGGASLHSPPGVPFLLGGVHTLIGGDPHTATLVVNVVTTTLVILPIAGIAGMVAGRRGAVLAAWFAALCPAIAVLALASGGSAGPFTLLVVTALWLGLRSASWTGSRALWSAFGVGLLVGGAYLTRPEGLLFAIVLVPVLALPALGGWRGIRRANGGWRRAGTIVAAFALGLALLAVPYVAYLHRETGSWQLTTKSQATSMSAWKAVAEGNRDQTRQEQYTLAEGSYEIRASEDVSSLVRDDPAGFVRVVGANARELASVALEPVTTPYPHWVLLPALLFLLAAYAVWRFRRDRVVLATVAAIAVPVVAALAYFVQARYLVPSVALVCALVAIGVLALPGRWAVAGTVVTIVLLAASTAVGLYSPVDGWFHPSARNPEKQVVGDWIEEHSDHADLLMGTSAVIGYYADRAVVPVPFASPARTIDFARHYGVRYVVVDRSNTVRYRPQLARFMTSEPGPGVRRVFGGRAPSPGTVVLELVPRPPRYEGEVPFIDQPPKGN